MAIDTTTTEDPNNKTLIDVKESRSCLFMTMCDALDQKAKRCATCFDSKRYEMLNFFGSCWCMERPPASDIS